MPRNDALDSYLDSLGGSGNNPPKRDSSPREKREPKRTQEEHAAPRERPVAPKTQQTAPRVQPARPKAYPSQRYRNRQQEPVRRQSPPSTPSEDEISIQSMLDDISSSTVEINKPAEKRRTHTNRELSSELDEFLARAEREDREKRQKQAEIDAASRNVPPQGGRKHPEQEMIQESLYEEEDKAPSDSLQELFAQSESFFKDDWIEMYEKAQRSRKNNEIADKIRRGRFRINREHQVEILPDMRTDDKSADDMLGSQWL